MEPVPEPDPVAGGTVEPVPDPVPAGAIEITPQTPKEGKRSSGSLIVYSGRSESLVGPIIDVFREATGIKVSVKYGGTAEIAATLLEEGRNSPADVFFAQDPGGLAAVASRLAPLPDDIVGLVPKWARSPEKSWVGISGRARVVVYNTNRLKESDLPSPITGFTDPRWKGKIGWAPLNASFQAMVTAMRVMWGEAETTEWLKGILANKPRDYPGNTQVVDATGSGEIEVGLTNHYYLYQFLKERGEGFPARNHYFADGGPGSLVMVAGAGILQTAKNRGNAEQFLRFLLSKVAQQYFAAQTFEYPLVEGISTSPLILPLEQVNGPNIDMASLGDIKGTQALLRDLGIIP